MSATKYYTDGHSVRFDNGSHGGIYCVATDVQAAGEICNKLNTQAELLEALRRISNAEADGFDGPRDAMVLERVIKIAQNALAKAHN